MCKDFIHKLQKVGFTCKLAQTEQLIAMYNCKCISRRNHYNTSTGLKFLEVLIEKKGFAKIKIKHRIAETKQIIDCLSNHGAKKCIVYNRNKNQEDYSLNLSCVIDLNSGKSEYIQKEDSWVFGMECKDIPITAHTRQRYS